MTDTKVVLRVVTILGALGFILALGLLVLSHQVIQQGTGANDIDPAAVALAGAIASAFTGVAGFIGGLLSTTGSGDVQGVERARLIDELEELKAAGAGLPARVEVINEPDEPVPVANTPEP